MSLRARGSEPAAQVRYGQAVSTALGHAANAADKARAAWREAARNWDTYTTGPGTALTPVGAEIGDLVLWTGRLAYTNPAWTPAGPHASPVRTGSAIAGTAAMLTDVVTALHQADDALVHIAGNDRESVRSAAAQGNLSVPTRLLTAECDVPYRYTPALPAMIDALLITYDTAVQDATSAATALDILAFALNHRPAVLAALCAVAPLSGPRLPSAAVPATRPITAPAPGHVEQALRSYGISQPAVLAHAAQIDEETSALVTKAAAISQRRATVSRRARRATEAPAPARLAVQDSPPATATPLPRLVPITHRL